jgi:hypothetical protein
MVKGDAQRECAGKTAHDNAQQAKAHIRRMIRGRKKGKSGGERRGEQWTYYRCPHCDKWHVGHVGKHQRSKRQEKKRRWLGDTDDWRPT